MSFFIFQIEAEMICIGERIKKGNFRPCMRTIPQSTITGALKDYTGIPNLYCLGYWHNPSGDKRLELPSKVITCAPHYIDRSNPRLPLFIEYLERPKGRIYIEKNPDVPEPDIILDKLPKGAEGSRIIHMGALKSKGFGRCTIKYLLETTENDLEPVRGFLLTSLYADQENLTRFGVQEINKPYWGYLFKPEPRSFLDGDYVKCLLEGSDVKASRFLIKERSRT